MQHFAATPPPPPNRSACNSEVRAVDVGNGRGNGHALGQIADPVGTLLLTPPKDHHATVYTCAVGRRVQIPRGNIASGDVR